MRMAPRPATALVYVVILMYYGYVVGPSERMAGRHFGHHKRAESNYDTSNPHSGSGAAAGSPVVEVGGAGSTTCTMITPAGSHEALSMAAAGLDCADVPRVNCSLVNGECHLMTLSTSLRIRNKNIDFPIVFPALKQIMAQAVGIEIQGNTFVAPGGTILFGSLKTVTATDPTIVIQHNVNLEKIDFPQLHTVTPIGKTATARIDPQKPLDWFQHNRFDRKKEEKKKKGAPPVAGVSEEIHEEAEFV